MNEKPVVRDYGPATVMYYDGYAPVVYSMTSAAVSKGGDTKMANAKTQKKRAKKAVKKPVKPEKEKK